MLYAPLITSILFLTFSIFYFLFGPIKYQIYNTEILVSYFIFYLLTASLGYIFGISFGLRLKINKSKRLLRLSFTLVALASFIANLIFNYILASGSLIPYNYFSFIRSLASGDFESIANLYYLSKIEAESNDTNVLISLLFFLMGWVRFVIIPYTIWNWGALSKPKKVISIMLCIMPILTGLSIGLNKPIFDAVIFFFLFSVIALIARTKNGHIAERVRLVKLTNFSLLAVAIAVIIFGYAMNSRGVNFDYIEYNSPLGDISIKSNIPENGFSVSAVMLGHYMFQGYYGLSLSLNQRFDSTYGFGHSPFLVRQFERLTDSSLVYLTFQEKIDPYWPNGLRWHSAFAQFANDVHFVGVGFLMFLFFFIMALTWVFAYKYNLREFLYFMPMHGILVIFLPANNQVFGFADSFSFCIVIFLSLLVRLSYYSYNSNAPRSVN